MKLCCRLYQACDRSFHGPGEQPPPVDNLGYAILFDMITQNWIAGRVNSVTLTVCYENSDRSRQPKRPWTHFHPWWWARAARGTASKIRFRTLRLARHGGYPGQAR